MDAGHWSSQGRKPCVERFPRTSQEGHLTESFSGSSGTTRHWATVGGKMLWGSLGKNREGGIRELSFSAFGVKSGTHVITWAKRPVSKFVRCDLFSGDALWLAALSKWVTPPNISRVSRVTSGITGSIIHQVW